MARKTANKLSNSADGDMIDCDADWPSDVMLDLAEALKVSGFPETAELLEDASLAFEIERRQMARKRAEAADDPRKGPRLLN